MKWKNLMNYIFLKQKKLKKYIYFKLESSSTYRFYKEKRFFIHISLISFLIGLLRSPGISQALNNMDLVKDLTKFFIGNKTWLLLVCYFGLSIKIVAYTVMILFVYWLFFYNLVPYIAIEHEEHKTEEFKNFISIRRKRWIVLPILFFLIYPNVTLGKEFFFVPFYTNAILILSPFITKKLYFDNDGYYNDFLYMHLFKAYKDDPNALNFVASYDDALYINTINFIVIAHLVLIVVQIHEDWIYPFELFVRRNIRRTNSFKFLATNLRILKNWLKKFLISYEPSFELFFKEITDLWKKYIKRDFIMLDEEEYDKFYRKKLDLYCKYQAVGGIYIKIFNKYLLEIYNFIKDEISRYKNSK